MRCPVTSFGLSKGMLLRLLHLFSRCPQLISSCDFVSQPGFSEGPLLAAAAAANPTARMFPLNPF